MYTGTLKMSKIYAYIILHYNYNFMLEKIVYYLK